MIFDAQSIMAITLWLTKRSKFPPADINGYRLKNPD